MICYTQVIKLTVENIFLRTCRRLTAFFARYSSSIITFDIGKQGTSSSELEYQAHIQRTKGTILIAIIFH